MQKLCGKSLRTESASAERERAAAGADGIEEVENALLLHFRGHGNCGGIECGKAGANVVGAGDYAADACGEIVGALVAENLERHAGRDFAFECGIGGVLGPCLREGGKEAAGGRAEAGAGDVDVHGGAVEVDGLG